MAPQNSTFLSDDESLPSEISRLSPIHKSLNDEFGGSSCQVNEEPYYEVCVTILKNDIEFMRESFNYVSKKILNFLSFWI